MKEPKVHYKFPYNTKTDCGKPVTNATKHTFDVLNVTCKSCLKSPTTWHVVPTTHHNVKFVK